jgi:hypothetical protein
MDEWDQWGASIRSGEVCGGGNGSSMQTMTPDLRLTPEGVADPAGHGGGSYPAVAASPRRFFRPPSARPGSQGLHVVLERSSIPGRAEGRQTQRPARVPAHGAGH